MYLLSAPRTAKFAAPRWYVGYEPYDPALRTAQQAAQERWEVHRGGGPCAAAWAKIMRGAVVVSVLEDCASERAALRGELVWTGRTAQEHGLARVRGACFSRVQAPASFGEFSARLAAGGECEAVEWLCGVFEDARLHLGKRCYRCRGDHLLRACPQQQPPTPAKGKKKASIQKKIEKKEKKPSKAKGKNKPTKAKRTYPSGWAKRQAKKGGGKRGTRGPKLSGAQKRREGKGGGTRGTRGPQKSGAQKRREGKGGGRK